MGIIIIDVVFFFRSMESLSLFIRKVLVIGGFIMFNELAFCFLNILVGKCFLLGEFCWYFKIVKN